MDDMVVCHLYISILNHTIGVDVRGFDLGASHDLSRRAVDDMMLLMIFSALAQLRAAVEYVYTSTINTPVVHQSEHNGYCARVQPHDPKRNIQAVCSEATRRQDSCLVY